MRVVLGLAGCVRVVFSLGCAGLYSRELHEGDLALCFS